MLVVLYHTISAKYTFAMISKYACRSSTSFCIHIIKLICPSLDIEQTINLGDTKYTNFDSLALYSIYIYQNTLMTVRTVLLVYFLCVKGSLGEGDLLMVHLITCNDCIKMMTKMTDRTFITFYAYVQINQTWLHICLLTLTWPQAQPRKEIAWWCWLFV